jgi:hypothetical protein
MSSFFPLSFRSTDQLIGKNNLTMSLGLVDWGLVALGDHRPPVVRPQAPNAPVWNSTSRHLRRFS